jgi:predicted  nucleic acid-binding Zn-ribbon protein
MTGSQNADVDAYVKTSLAAASKLKHIWEDLELGLQEQQEELSVISSRALNVWNSAVDAAEEHRSSLRQRLVDADKEIRKIQDQLGDVVIGTSVTQSTDSLFEVRT